MPTVTFKGTVVYKKMKVIYRRHCSILLSGDNVIIELKLTQHFFKKYQFKRKEGRKKQNKTKKTKKKKQPENKNYL
ncbi:hypothetical protein PGB90_005117 [Kerria lacca]